MNILMTIRRTMRLPMKAVKIIVENKKFQIWRGNADIGS